MTPGLEPQWKTDELFRLVLGSHLLGALGVVLTLEDTRGFSAPTAQVIKLGAADLAAADHLDGVDHRRIERKHALDALAIGDFTHCEVLVEPGAGAAACKPMRAFASAALAFDDLDVDDKRIAWLEVRDILAG